MINQIVCSTGANTRLASVAKTKGLAPFIKCSPRQRGDFPSINTLSSSISAIVFATYLDSDGDWTAVCRVITRLGFAFYTIETSYDSR